MIIEASFALDAENSAFALGVSWRASQFERIAGIRARMARLEADEVRVLAGLLFEAEGEAGEDAIDAGDPAEVTRRHDLAVRSIATEYAATACVGISTAQARLGEAWTLANELRDTLLALEAGQISRAHAHEIAAETEHLNGNRLDAEKALLPLAKRLPVSQFRRRAKRVLETLETDSVRVRHERARQLRRVDVSAGRDGMAYLEAYLDATDAALIATGLTNAAHEARAVGDSRTTPQLRADLLAEVLLNGAVTFICATPAPVTGSVPAGSTARIGAEPPEVSGASESVIVSSATLGSRAPVAVEVLIPAKVLAGRNDRKAGVAEITGVGVIDPRAARRLVARAPSLTRILTDPITSAIVDFDRKTYRVPVELKRVIRRRDGHCRAPGCHLPISATELDHTHAAARGGVTALWNLAHLCDNHHHLKHEAGWGLTQYLGGVLEWTAPSGRRYTTFPETDVSGPPGQPVDRWSPRHTGEHEPSPFDLPDEGDEDGGGDDGGDGDGEASWQGAR